MLSILCNEGNMKKICICDMLRDLVTFAQLKKHEKIPCRKVTLSKIAG